MKKTSTLLAIAFAAASSLFAQPLFQMNVLPNIGYSVLTHSGDTINISEGNATAFPDAKLTAPNIRETPSI